MNCTDCIYENNCDIRSLAPDVTGCEGHSVIKPEVEAALLEKLTSVPGEPIPTRKYTKLEDLKIGDRVRACCTVGTRIPTYLKDSPMTVIGFTRFGNVKCDYDGGKPFSIPPDMLLKI